MKSVLLVACALLLPVATLASANEGGGDGVYQRQRTHGGAGGAGGAGGRHGYYGGNFYGNSYYGGYYYQPPVYGSWYARPYPTHLDYFRLRSRTPPMVPPVDCPCAEGLEP
ncbi:MAG: hypothetical protein IH831_04050 [Planctomycetes bacterium]|nr:hypothetical protein [Planctomycetota bacterium]